MSTINPKQVWTRFVAWQDRLTMRVEINNLNDRTLRDIGLHRGNEFHMQSIPLLRVPGVF